MTADLNAEFALRFCIWTTTFGAAIIFAHWAYLLRHSDSEKVRGWVTIPLLAESIKHIAWSIHQYWYNQSWVLFMSNRDQHAEFQQFKWIVYGAEYIILLSMVGVLSPYLMGRFGPLWPLAGVGIIAALYGVGYGIGFPA